MIAYKLFRKRKNGTLGPLFINRKQIIPIGVWLEAEKHETKGYALRPGWHTTPASEMEDITDNPSLPHLSMKGRVWAKVEIEDYWELQRPKNQGGKWFIANKMKVLEEL